MIEHLQQPRHLTLDALRGIAVMGILLMNIIAFSMPSVAYINPTAWGGMTFADQAFWIGNFILVDAKFRSLFSIMFGASMLLFIESAERRSAGSSRSLHFRRMAWLAVFGLFHYAFIWFGDILFLYAIIGMIAWRWREKETSALYVRAAIFITLGFVQWAAIIGSIYVMASAAALQGADPQLARDLADVLQTIGAPGGAEAQKELAVYSGGYAGILAQRIAEEWSGPLILLFGYGFETLGLVALGMALYRSGFLTGGLAEPAYKGAIVFGYGIGFAGMVPLAIWSVLSGYDVLTTGGAVLAWSTPFRTPIAVAHAALAILLIKSFANTALVSRLQATGQAAFTNYLGTSIIMTTIFYGYGLGLFGEVSRAAVYIFVLVAWALMLIWSPWWMKHYHHGPLEWLWRSLTQGRMTPIRR
jgi:uncharacterized protein